MRRCSLLLMLSLAAGCGGSTDLPTAPPAIADVFTPGNVFSPFSTVIAVGGTVRFNISGTHDVTFTPVTGTPSNVNVTTDRVVSRTFGVTGTYPYDCKTHPGMAGQVIVQ